MNYKLSKGVGKAVRSFVYFGLPFLVTSFIQGFPDIANLTIGSVLVMLANYIKTKYPESTMGKVV